MSFPTQLTVLRIVLVPVFYILFAVVEPQEMLWAAITFLVASLSDWWDGYFARAYNSATSLGAFLDPLADKLLTSAAFIAFAVKDYIPWWMVAVIIGRDIYLTVFRLASDSVGMPVVTSYFAKVKTFVQMTFIAGFLAILLGASGTFGKSLAQKGTALSHSDYIYWSMAFLTLLTIVSAVQYSYDNWSALVRLSRRYFFRRSPQEL